MYSNKIAFWTEKKDTKHKAVAKACGVSAQTFSSWVKNKTQPDLIQAAIMAKLFNISIDELVEWEEEKNEKTNL